jgi:hypothetical protein
MIWHSVCLIGMRHATPLEILAPTDGQVREWVASKMPPISFLPRRGRESALRLGHSPARTSTGERSRGSFMETPIDPRPGIPTLRGRAWLLDGPGMPQFPSCTPSQIRSLADSSAPVAIPRKITESGRVTSLPTRTTQEGVFRGALILGSGPRWIAHSYPPNWRSDKHLPEPQASPQSAPPVPGCLPPHVTCPS